MNDQLKVIALIIAWALYPAFLTVAIARNTLCNDNIELSFAGVYSWVFIKGNEP